MTNTTPPPPTTPAGWYDDGQGRMRWWDGQSWTDAYAPVVVQPPRAPFNPFSILGFVLAIVGFFLAMGGVVGLGLGVLGLVASLGGYRDAMRRGRGLAVAGIVVSAVAIVIGGLQALRLFAGGAI
jgi:hypothetical protein